MGKMDEIKKAIRKFFNGVVPYVSNTASGDFAWINLSNELFDDKNIHFELCWDGKTPHQTGYIYADLHLETQNGVDKYKQILDDNQDIFDIFKWEDGYGCHLKNDCCIPIKKDSDEELMQCIETSIKQLYKLYDFIQYRLKMADYKTLLEENYNIIFHGAPGTGKTYLAHQIAEAMQAAKVGFVQFHPSFDYTDFVEGLRPVSSKSKNAEDLNEERIGFHRQDGIFKAFCVEAFNAAQKTVDKDKPKYVFIIDEINRGEINKIFGELFFSIDPGYRYLYDDKEEENNKRKVSTQYQNLIVDSKDPFKDGFFVPDNVYIIGTMNDIDRSVESMDFAFRRRFTFVEITAEDSQSMLYEDKAWKDNMPDTKTITKIKDVMNALNDVISGIEGLSSSYHIGAAYFLKLKDGNFQNLWNYHLKGLLREYLRGIDEDESKFKEIENQYNQAAGIKIK